MTRTPALNAAINLAIEIVESTDSVDLRVRAFDRPGLRFSKAELVACADYFCLDASGTRSQVLFRIARASR